MNKKFLLIYKLYLENEGIEESSLNQCFCALRKIATQVLDLKIWDEKVKVDFSHVKIIPQRGKKTGTWFSKEEVELLISKPNIMDLKVK